VEAVVLSEAADEAEFGGKAVQLGMALRCGLPVPPGWALSASFVDAVAGDDPRALEKIADLRTRLSGPVAVRSSAVGEDSVRASFAGQHLTRLGVQTEAGLTAAIGEIWRSAMSESALAYRRKLGIVGPPRMGVVMQELIDPECAGVLFTRNPLDGIDECVIEAAWGLGDAVVAGQVEPDRYRVSRRGVVLERIAGRKDRALRVRPEGGTEDFIVEPARADILCLEDGRLRKLWELAMACERCFEGPHDLEWAFRGDALYLLQRRAITRAGGA
jgi:pyruvate,water dikinase